MSFFTRLRRLPSSGWSPLFSVLAGLLVFAALVAPDQPTPGSFLRIPVEALVGVAVLLVLPRRAGRWVSVIAGVALALLTILKIVDLGFFSTLDRPFDLMYDWSLFEAAAGFLTDSVGQVGTIVAIVAAVLLAAALLLLLPLAVLRLSRVVTGHRTGAVRTLAVLAPVWILCAALGAQLVPGTPVAAGNTAVFAYQGAQQVRTDLRDRKDFASELTTDPFQDTPGQALLTGLRGKTVVLAFVESYGRSALEDPTMAPRVDALLDDGTRKLKAAGFAARSAFLTSPTFGGGSWLAHSTLLSGLWINNQQRFTDLEASNRLTLTRAFERASWHTVGVMPGVTSPWPQGAFYGYDQIFDAYHLGYKGPNFSFATMPDQFTLTALNHIEQTAPPQAPVMAMMPLISSHAPWSPLPRMVDWNKVGDGSVFRSMAGPNAMPQAILTRNPDVVRNDYRQSIEYSLTALISYLQNYGGDNLVFVFLGDHQPAPIVTGQHASRDVPITIVARDPAVLDRIAGWGWQDGLRPSPQAPVWRMDAFRDRFLTAFGSQPGPPDPRRH